MSGEHDKQAAPEVIHGPEPRPSWGTPTPPPKLGPLPEHIDVGSVPVDAERTFLVAAPFMMNRGRGELETSIEPRVANRSTPSTFRDQLGLDPDPVLDGAAAEAFHLASPAKHPVTGYGPPPPVRVRFRPSRPGPFEVAVRISVVVEDGTTDTKIIRVTGSGAQVKQAPMPAGAPGFDSSKIIDDVHGPNMEKTMEGAIKPKPFTPLAKDTATFEAATKVAEATAARLVASQADGVGHAGEEIKSYQKLAVPPSMFDAIIEVAFMMGVSGIAGVVAKYLAQNLTNIGKTSPPTTPSTPTTPTPSTPAPSTPAPSTPAPTPDGKEPASSDSAKEVSSLMQNQLREGFRSVAKIAHKNQSGSKEPGADKPHRGTFSTNAVLDFIAEHRHQVRERGAAYTNIPIAISEALRTVEPEQARAAMITLEHGLASASAVADQIQAHATKLEWIAAVARAANGETKAELPDGSKAETTNLDKARNYGAETWYSESPAAKHDGLLDIHVELPVGMTPVEMSGFKVKSASITGVSQEIADKLIDLHLAHAGIPIRLVVSGHPALITRDELGRVRINGYLLTKDNSAGDGPPRWTEAHMHRGAKLLVDKVLSKTLRGWGIEAPKSDDATGRGNVAK